MRLPELSGAGRSVDYAIEFKGINHNLYVGENQFYDTYNLCSTNYPVMTPRAARATVTTLESAQGIFARGKLMWAAGNKLYYDGEQISGVTLTAGKKQFVGMGAYVIVFPDGVRYNTSTGAVDRLNASTTVNPAVVYLSRQDGTTYNVSSTGSTPPTNPSAGSYWLDTSQETAVLRVYSAAGSWTAILTTYLKVQATGIAAGLKKGDAVKFEGSLEAINGTHEIVEKDASDGWVIISGILDQGGASNVSLTLSRTAPEMDFVCELNNRLWGCSNARHEIYACQLGDATNWNTLGTGAGDAWAATVGSDGDFTGCCAYMNSVLFFKEDMIHRVMGTKPSNFTITDTPARGVQKGSEKSLRVVNEVLLYKGRDGVMAYDGSSPMSVGTALGVKRMYEAAAGAEGDKYYISMRTEENEWGMWVFDEAKGLWHREDETHATAFAELDGQLYFLTSAGALMAARGRQETAANGDAELEEPFDWWAETGDLMIELPDYKYVSRIQVRASVTPESSLKIEAMYDSSGEWRTIYRHGPGRKNIFTVPMIPARCDHVRLRISGHGRSAVYAISKEYERGSEI